MGVDRDEQVGPQLAGDAVALLQHEEAIVAPGERDADTAGLEQFVAHRLRDGERQILLVDPHPLVMGARIVAAMARVDHHERAGRIARPRDRG